VPQHGVAAAAGAVVWSVGVPQHEVVGVLVLSLMADSSSPRLALTLVDTENLAACFDGCQDRHMSNLSVVELPVLSDEAEPCCPPVTSAELSETDAVRMAAMFKALGDPVRLRLFSKIASHAGGEACVCDIQDVGVSQPTVSHHLKKLREAGLLSSERRGTWVYYRVEPGVLAAMATLLATAR
jgi:ArsR family transcriptional regulator, arsenate/arsenite/antimonite-responsive transcriptional repressor